MKRLLLFVLVGCLGCGVQARYGSSIVPSAKLADTERVAGEVSDGRPAAEGDVIAEAQGDRKIIYRASVELIVEDVAEIEQAMAELVAASKGYVSEFHEDRSYRERLRGYWTVRIPVNQFDQFLAEVVAMGTPVDKQITAEDVTEEYIDLDRRLANKRVLEQRMLKLLEEQTGEIKDVIEVETQLARVREEIERMQGRMRYLSDHIAMTTVEITAREDDRTTRRQVTFAGRITESFSDSIHALWMLGQGLVILVVAALPWMLVFGLILAVPVTWLRRRRQAVRGLD